MYVTDWITARAYQKPVICPACSASDYKDCHFDQHLHQQLVCEADCLVQEGRTREALDILIPLYARRIADRVHPRWRCLSCWAKFDV